jgi:large subunit ribosomal protein L30
MAKKVQITQKRSTIKRPETQIRTIQSLGLGKINRTVEVELTPQIAGMIKKVNHLITVKEI